MEWFCLEVMGKWYESYNNAIAVTFVMKVFSQFSLIFISILNESVPPFCLTMGETGMKRPTSELRMNGWINE